VKYRWRGLVAKRPAGASPDDAFPDGLVRSRTPANAGRRGFIAAATGALVTVLARDTSGFDVSIHARDRATKTFGRADVPPERDYSPEEGGFPPESGSEENRRANDCETERLEHPDIVAPPGGYSTERLLAQCTACQLCVSACPSHVIEPAVLHYGSLRGFMKPRLDFDKGFCNINCTVCTDVCPDGALTPLTPEAKQTTRIGLAYIAHPRCIIVKDGTACGACAECCPTAALQMEKVPNYPEPVPVVDPRYCIGCGACQYACPTLPKAVVVSGLATHEKAELFVQEQVKPATTDDFAF
jgi:formate hydrogenlyase subunit 6/NADH:ubiquinone oxidoreductase subunit I